MKNSLLGALSEINSELWLETLVNPLRAAIRRENENGDQDQAEHQSPGVISGKDLFQDHL
jgi:hypothetical protein